MPCSTTETRIGPRPQARDVLTDLLRQGAQQLLAQAIEAEVADGIDRHQDCRDAAGRRQVVRNGHLPERTLTTGVGPVTVQQPRVQDRRTAGAREKFSSAILPPYLRKTKSVEERLPWRYLKGVSIGDFSAAVAALLGPDAQGLSATTVTRRKGLWQQEYHDWSKRALAGKQDVYVWADGVHFHSRLEGGRQCLLVLMGATPDGKKERIAIQDGDRESEPSWKELRLDVQARDLVIEPKRAIGDGAWGFWKAVRQVWSETQAQRCWVHKTANVLDKLPQSVPPKAKELLHELYLAPSRAEAEKAFDWFVRTYEAKYPQATECLVKDRQELLVFYAFPAAHWMHLRTPNGIESVFATVRLRTEKTKGSGTRVAWLTMVFKLMPSASRRWRARNGSGLLNEVIKGTVFVEGIRKEDAA
jgi:transposase-like protein